MEKVSLYFGREDLKDVISDLGDSGLVQLEDCNPNNKQLDTEEYRAIERLEQRLNYFRNDIKIVDLPEEAHPCASYAEARTAVNEYYSRLVELRHIEKEYRELEVKAEEDYVIARETRGFLRGVVPPGTHTIDFSLMAGIVDRERKFLAKKTLRMRLRCNTFVKLVDVDLQSQSKQKSVVLVYAVGEEARMAAGKVVESLGGREFNFDDSAWETTIRRGLNGVEMNKCERAPNERRLGDDDVRALKAGYKKLRKIHTVSQKKITSFLQKAGAEYVGWISQIAREKRLLEAMARLKPQDGTGCLLGEGWVLSRKLKGLTSFRKGDEPRGRFAFAPIQAESTPPTHFETSEFMDAFQGFTNVFGVPKYREINPAIFLVFTFPFMFGAMFGDVLHGLLLLFISALLIWNYNRLNRNCGVFQIILEGRYVMLCCAFAAIWFGFLYGDFGSLPLVLFHSKYETGRTYPFGIDPVWHHAENRTVFINSVKMKLSLILGFAHMSLGSLISIANAIHFQDRLTLFCTAIPQFIVFSLFLGYLVFLCIYKWLITRTYPSLVNTLIGMYTSPFTITQPMYQGQLAVQLSIFALMALCVPWMFLSKPIYTILRRRVPSGGMLDLWITSGIHVVEFGLGLISNTSSYLRLWAVSLAHVQLTSVLHQFTIGNNSWLISICLFPVYIICTGLLLIGLEGLSACLHALRLNWIEFFSKFYSGGGKKFEPFTFKLTYEEIHNNDK